MPKWEFIALTPNSRSETIVPFCWNGLITRSLSIPSSALKSIVASGLAIIVPKLTPFVTKCFDILAFLDFASLIAFSAWDFRSVVISLAINSIHPDPKRPIEVLSLPIVFKVWFSLLSPCLPSKFANAIRSAKTNTFVALLSPPPIRGIP